MQCCDSLIATCSYTTLDRTMNVTCRATQNSSSASIVPCCSRHLPQRTSHSTRRATDRVRMKAPAARTAADRGGGGTVEDEVHIGGLEQRLQGLARAVVGLEAAPSGVPGVVEEHDHPGRHAAVHLCTRMRHSVYSAVAKAKRLSSCLHGVSRYPMSLTRQSGGECSKSSHWCIVQVFTEVARTLCAA